MSPEDRRTLQHVCDMLCSIQNDQQQQTCADPALADLSRRVGILEERTMSLKDDFDAAMAKIDTTTTDLGVRIDAIVAKLQNPNMTPAERDASLAHLSAIADNLGAMAKDPVNPTPAVTPLPPAPTS